MTAETPTPTEAGSGEREVAAVVREETDRIAAEWQEWVQARAKARRSSMPVYLEDVALILVERAMLLAREDRQA